MIKPTQSYALTENGICIIKGSSKALHSLATKSRAKNPNKEYTVYLSHSSKVGDDLDAANRKAVAAANAVYQARKNSEVLA